MEYITIWFCLLSIFALFLILVSKGEFRIKKENWLLGFTAALVTAILCKMNNISIFQAEIFIFGTFVFTMFLFAEENRNENIAVKIPKHKEKS